MSTAQRMLTAIKNGTAHVEQFYDEGIVEPGYKGSNIVIKGSALFAALAVSFAAAPELANLSLGTGTIEAYAMSALKSAMVGGGAWIGLTTGAAAMTHVLDDEPHKVPRRYKP